jgi:hypothetical protein
MRAPIALIALAGLGSSALVAQAASPSRTPAQWEFTIAPYALFPTMQGTNTVGVLPPLSIDASAKTIFSHLQGGAMLYFGMKKGDWAFATDALYMKLGQDLNPDGNYVSGTLTMKQAAWEAFILYHFAPDLEVGAGGLFNKIEAGVSATGPGNTPLGGSQSESWGVPVVALRWTPIDDEHWHGLVFGDYGGTSGSNWTWQVMPSVGYRFGRTFELALQYRYIALDFATGSGTDYFMYRMNIFGPQLGIAFHF